MMRQVELRGCIPPECYSSQKNHEVIEVAINHHLIANILHQKFIPSTIASVNAQS